MPENCVEIPANNEREENSPTDSSQLKLLEKIIDAQNKQDKFTEEILKNQQNLLDDLISVKSQLEDLKTPKTPKSDENMVEITNSPPPPPPAPGPIVSKQFVLRHVFKDMAKMKQEGELYSDIEEFFGIPWSISTYREDDNFEIYLQCERPETGSQWSIHTEFVARVINLSNGKISAKSAEKCFVENGGFGWGRFMRWNELERDYLDDGDLRVEFQVNITAMTGIYKENLCNFDESMKDLSDIVLIVKNRRFHVAKLYLATHSNYFKAMFLGMFGESKQSEIRLTGIDPDDFQNYLEVLYGEYAIDEYTVEGILLVADMYDTQIVIRKCEEFLLKQAKKSLKKMLQMAARYHMEQLKKKCLFGIRTMADIRSVATSDVHDMDPLLIAILFEKTLHLK